MFAKARKAFLAGASVAATAVGTVVLRDGIPNDAASWGAVLGSALSLGIAAGFATYFTKNRKTGPDPS